MTARSVPLNVRYQVALALAELVSWPCETPIAVARADADSSRLSWAKATWRTGIVPDHAGKWITPVRLYAVTRSSPPAIAMRAHLNRGTALGLLSNLVITSLCLTLLMADSDS